MIDGLAAQTCDRLSSRFYPCSGRKILSEPVVLIHGWGNDSRVWEPLLPCLAPVVDVIVIDLPGFGDSTPVDGWQQVVEELAAALPERFALLGWSLGGMLAVQLARRFPERVCGLVTLASNAVYVAREGWPTAVPGTVFDSFYRSYRDNSQFTLKQFCALEAKGDDDERSLLRWLRRHSATAGKVWSRGLDWLRELDNRQALAELELPSLHIFGEGDQLVPVAASEPLAGLNPCIQVEVIAGCGHAPHISRPESVARKVTAYLGARDQDRDARESVDDGHRLAKERIAASFGKAAASYDAVAQLQRDVGEQLLAMIPDVPAPAHIADMGCGTGYFTAKLKQHFPGALCTGVDLAPGMVAYAANHYCDKDIRWLCGDAETVPLADGSLDLIFSNFTFQWCQDLSALMAEQYRLLSPGGWLVFTTVGPRSLWELRRAWQEVDSYVHVNQFAPLEDVRFALRDAGFNVAGWDEKTLTRHYEQLGGLTRELKGLGAHNVNGGRNSALTGRQRIEKLKAAYEPLRQRQGLPATWEMLFVSAKKPEL